MEYAYVKLINDKHGLEQRCKKAQKQRSKAWGYAEAEAKHYNLCDALLKNNLGELFLGFKEKPESDNTWWRKNSIAEHDGYYIPIAKKNSKQGKRLSSIQYEYNLATKDCKSTTSLVTGDYPEFPMKIIDSSSGRLKICSSVFGLIDSAQLVIIGKIPFSKDSPLSITGDFEEITASEFHSYFGS